MAIRYSLGVLYDPSVLPQQMDLAVGLWVKDIVLLIRL